MTKPPDDMTTLWVRDENGDMRRRVKQGARMKGQKVADFLRNVIDAALDDTRASFFSESDRKIDQGEGCNCGHHDS